MSILSFCLFCVPDHVDGHVDSHVESWLSQFVSIPCMNSARVYGATNIRGIGMAQYLRVQAEAAVFAIAACLLPYPRLAIQ